MTVVRAILLLGLVFHKVLWELMKTGPGVASTRMSSPSFAKRAVKWGKAGVLGFIVVQTLGVDIMPISRPRARWTLVGTAIYLLGLAMAVAGRLQLGRNWANVEDGQVLPGQQLIRHGIYAYVRHPIYVGDLLLLAGLELALNSWLVLGVLVPFLVVLRQSAAEEALLSRAFEDYGAYCKQSKRFIPFVL